MEEREDQGAGREGGELLSFGRSGGAYSFLGFFQASEHGED